LVFGMLLKKLLQWKSKWFNLFLHLMVLTFLYLLLLLNALFTLMRNNGTILISATDIIIKKSVINDAFF
jgi:hypothetical protein